MAQMVIAFAAAVVEETEAPVFVERGRRAFDTVILPVAAEAEVAAAAVVEPDIRTEAAVAAAVVVGSERIRLDRRSMAVSAFPAVASHSWTCRIRIHQRIHQKL